MEIGEIIKTERKKIGMTQEVLAEKLSVSRVAVAKWEQGASIPTPNHIAELSEILNISITQLYRESLPENETAAALEHVLQTLESLSNEIQILLKNI